MENEQAGTGVEANAQEADHAKMNLGPARSGSPTRDNIEATCVNRTGGFLLPNEPKHDILISSQIEKGLPSHRSGSPNT